MKNLMLEILKREVRPAMGCTEPVAVVLAAAKARELGGHRQVKEVEVLVSPNFFKNGLSVGIPQSDAVGMDVAAAIGACGGESKHGLGILSTVAEKQTAQAARMIESGIVKLGIADTDQKVLVDVCIRSDEGESRARIQGTHDHFSRMEVNGEVVHVSDCSCDASFDDSLFHAMTIREIIQEIEAMEPGDLLFLLEGLEMNQAVAEQGLKEKRGMGVGYTLKQRVDRGELAEDLAVRAMYLTAAGSDARMSGICLPVMSSNGSGNNGLTAILPIVAYAQTHDVKKPRLAKALAISHLINCYIKNEIGRLSALCSCAVSAATGSGAALTWLMGGGESEISGTIQNMLANLSGLICDGAKNGCALKLATAASTGVHMSMLSLSGAVVAARDGIVGRSVEESIRNLGVVSARGMKVTDAVILDVMKQMHEHSA